MTQHTMLCARSAGFALLAVLWVIAGATTLGFTTVLAARDAVASAHTRLLLMRSQWIAEGCIEEARSRIAAAISGQAVSGESWVTLDVLFDAIPSAGNQCTVSAQAAGTTLDVNHASGEQLRALFLAIGGSASKADSLRDAILDWRDADEIQRLYGAEASWYQHERRVSPRNGAIADPAELLLIRGAEGFDNITSVLGTEPGRISLRHASPAVLGSLPGVGAEVLAELVAARDSAEDVVDIMTIANRVSNEARITLIARSREFLRLTTNEPDAWILAARASIGDPPVTSIVEVRLQRAGSRAAVIRKRTWVE